jgi:hypothetical protein
MQGELSCWKFLTRAEAKTIVVNDPAVKSGIFVYEMHPWKLQPWEEFAKKAKGATQ